ncbi:MAG: alanine dehydrogenase [Anaerolineales bacterium]|nr:alanine dehydrogenase [Anaerolineales bacterium]
MIKFGVPKEIRDMETRVGLTPAGVEALTHAGHVVYIERHAGRLAGYNDEAYRAVGAQIVYSAAEAYGRADVVCKIARPTAEEHKFFRDEQTICAFHNLAVASPDLVEAMTESRITAVAYETIAEPSGERPVLLSASEIAGRLAPIIAGNLLMQEGGRGILLGGLPGIPRAAVVILGAGTLGSNATHAFLGAGAQVVVLDTDINHLRQLEQATGRRITTMFANPYNINRATQFADVLVGAVAVAGQRAPILVSDKQVREMRRGSIILDFAIDEGGCIATSRPMTRRQPTFAVHDVIHYCVPNITAAVGRTASKAITNAALPYLLALGESDLHDTQTWPTAIQQGIEVLAGERLHNTVRQR